MQKDTGIGHSLKHDQPKKGTGHVKQTEIKHRQIM